MQWNSSYQESIFSFANNINTHEGGSHLSGFRSALTRTLNQYAREKGAAQGEGREPRRRGRARGPDRGHLGQAARPAVRGPDEDQARQPGHAGLRRVDRQREARRVPRGEPAGGATRSSARRSRPRRRARPRARRATSRGASRRWRTRALPGKLADCSVKDPALSRDLHRRGRLGRRLGQAGPRPQHAGGAAAARQDPQRREGRIDKVLQNTEIQALITAIGTGVRDEFDIEKARYHKIILMTDADVDGAHIRTLVADAAVPRDAGADRGRLRLHRQAAAVQAHAGPPGALHREGVRARGDPARRQAREVRDLRPPRQRQFKLTEARWQRYTRLLKQYEGWASALRAEHGHDVVDVPRGVADPRRGDHRRAEALELLVAAPTRRTASRTTSSSLRDDRSSWSCASVERKTGLARTHRLRRALFEAHEYRQLLRVHRQLVRARRHAAVHGHASASTTTRRCRSRSCAAPCSSVAAQGREAPALQGPRRDERRPARARRRWTPRRARCRR